MIRVLTILGFLGLFACGNSASSTEERTPGNEPTEETATAQNTLSEAERAEGWELLFDGKSTEHWRGYNHPTFPDRGWGVKAGELQVYHSGTEEAGFGGDIVTKQSYSDFILSVDFALSDTSNSGIFYLVQEVEDTPIWYNAPEYQLLDDETYKQIMDITPAQLSGANYDMHAQEVNYSKPIGEWNTAVIEKRGNQVRHLLNGELVVEYELYSEDWNKRYENSKFKEHPNYAKAISGPIGLQDHGHLCRFRNIKIKVL